MDTRRQEHDLRALAYGLNDLLMRAGSRDTCDLSTLKARIPAQLLADACFDLMSSMEKDHSWIGEVADQARTLAPHEAASEVRHALGSLGGHLQSVEAKLERLAALQPKGVDYPNANAILTAYSALCSEAADALREANG